MIKILGNDFCDLRKYNLSSPTQLKDRFTEKKELDIILHELNGIKDQYDDIKNIKTKQKLKNLTLNSLEKEKEKDSLSNKLIKSTKDPLKLIVKEKEKKNLKLKLSKSLNSFNAPTVGERIELKKQNLLKKLKRKIKNKEEIIIKKLNKIIKNIKINL